MFDGRRDAAAQISVTVGPLTARYPVCARHVEWALARMAQDIPRMIERFTGRADVIDVDEHVEPAALAPAQRLLDR